MTSTTFWSTVEYNRNHYGNAYVLINTEKKKGNKVETTLWILPSEDVEVWYDDAKKLSDIPDIYYIYILVVLAYIDLAQKKFYILKRLAHLME